MKLRCDLCNSHVGLRCGFLYIRLFGLLLLISGSVQAQSTPPTLEDFWEGRAEWVVDVADVGLPIGESDTLAISDDTYWSYLHGSNQSHGVIDQCGQAVEFPGCTVRWESTDDGQTFTLPVAVCMMTCETCPCDDNRDHITAQQYPRVVATDDLFYMAYEWHAQTILRTSEDGINWSDWVYLRVPGGTWPPSYAPCSETERIGAHPFIRGQADGCLVGAPPGLYIEGDTIYVFVEAGSAPAHMRCYKGDRHGPLDDLQVCETDPLFGGATEYGPVDILGAAANPYFDFRYISSADVLHVGEHYYMFYEGIRGPDQLERGMDTQFALGLARSTTNAIDGPWERYTDNPIIQDLGFNVGIGHADVIVIEGVTYLYTATDEDTRGRYVLRWKE
ncbi:hypothetical protein G4Y79_00560 [Phototrophicus methaneseepsis]|uniref:Uncharacterized protein n=1 Tax=Phototrophicus methaneseepsis TaxID=2710758 RepID=A0A7S8E9K5_9CHLR|nr:hypothetical protein [Phototrophicus methaneseepsis]QPC82896.1 hypothetical protein G4Y79_00560 [Phototrophicus methaneseepsis]